MSTNPALHPRRLDTHPNIAHHCPKGAGMPEIGAGSGTDDVPVTVPCSAHFDPHEARTYAGIKAADLVEHAKDIEATRLEKPLRPGSSARCYARISTLTDSALHTALRAYIKVKTALRLVARPLQARARRRQSLSKDIVKPTAPKIWITKVPTQAQWEARDLAAGYDIRGTSPTWILRRAYRHRKRRCLELEPPLETAYRSGLKAHSAKINTADFIGPPQPLHYKDVDDLYQIWPPITLPKGPEGLLPRLDNIDLIHLNGAEADEDLAYHIDRVVEGYNFALEQFGKDGTDNYLRYLTDTDANLMDRILSRYHATNREMPTKNKEPP